MTTYSPTVDVAQRHINMQGVSALGMESALHALFSFPSTPQDRDSLERCLILSSELTQIALNIARNEPGQDITVGMVMLRIQFAAMRELAERLGVTL